MRDEDFLAGNYIFKQQGSSAGIINRGKINASAGGAIALLGGAIENSGSLKAENGQVLLGVGKQISLNIDKNLGVDITVDQALEDKAQNFKNAITNTGSIQGNFIKAQAEFTNAIYDRAINNEGVIEAAGLVNNNGIIELISKTGIVENSSKVLANSEIGTGGSIKVIGSETYLLNGSQIEASGKTGGGEILIGGDFQGKNPEIQNSEKTFIGENAQIKANALESGNGGKIIVWADDSTWFYGSAEAKGITGNGGFIEISGKEGLIFDGLANTSSLYGDKGTVLFDPKNIFITNTAAPALPVGNVQVSTLAELTNLDTINDYYVTPAQLLALSLGANISLLASNDINFNSALTLNNQSLSANAGNDINVNAQINKTGANTNYLSLRSNNNVRINNGGSINATGGKLNVGLFGNQNDTGIGQGDVRVDGAINTIANPD